MSRDYWSNSSLSCLTQCGEKYRRRYIENERFPPSPRQLRGRVVHEVAQGAYQHTLNNEPLPTAEEAKDQAASAFETEWLKGVEPDKDDPAPLPTAKGTSKDFAVDLSGYHVVTVAPTVTPIAVEERLTVTPPDSDLVIHGIVDLIDLTPQGDVIRDLKTAEKSPASDAAEKSQQLSFYSLIWHTDTGVLPARLTLDTLVRTPARAEKKYVQLHTRRDAADDAALVQRLNTAVETVKRGLFMPAPMDSWQCSPRWCEFYTTCVYTRRGERPTT